MPDVVYVVQSPVEVAGGAVPVQAGDTVVDHGREQDEITVLLRLPRRPNLAAIIAASAAFLLPDEADLARAKASLAGDLVGVPEGVL